MSTAAVMATAAMTPTTIPAIAPSERPGLPVLGLPELCVLLEPELPALAGRGLKVFDHVDAQSGGLVAGVIEVSVLVIVLMEGGR